MRGVVAAVNHAHFDLGEGGGCTHSADQLGAGGACVCAQLGGRGAQRCGLGGGVGCGVSDGVYTESAVVGDGAGVDASLYLHTAVTK